ncbi:hypothetical protein GL279_18735 [Paracoccus limosus]|uniref:Uncharacterized protein n=1 Tax=Paracoccus limosus TaxID=913252 RepID=A0A844HBG6_9RHOB|nr:hypothetical protein [Paracoccus limosus]MTH36618.1 hypothetical protein [Paracoccus limosus]
MPTLFDVIITGEPARPAPEIRVDGRPVQDGERVTMDLAQAVDLLERGLAVRPGKVEVTVAVKPGRAGGVMLDGGYAAPGTRVGVDWATAQNLVWRGRAELAPGVTLPSQDPDRPK